MKMHKDYEKLISDIRDINKEWDVFYDEGEDFPNGDKYYSNVKICVDSESSGFINIFDNSYFVSDETIFDFKEKKKLIELIELMDLVEKFVHEPEGIKCPLCDGIAEYRQGKNGSVHAWVCPDCSMVMFEYDNDKKYYALGELLGVKSLVAHC